MKNSAYRYSQLKHQLSQKKHQGEEFIIWKLNKYQKDYIISLGYRIESYLYEITTCQLYNYTNNSLLRDIHYAKLRGKHKIYKILDNKSYKILDNLNIPYKVIKYKIYLQENRT